MSLFTFEETIGMKKIYIFPLCIFLLFSTFISFGQSVEEIKSDNQNYIWGEGSSSTLNRADQEALNMLINQISAQVESSFTHLTEEFKRNKKYDFKESFQGVIKTYSSATLRNTERIVISNEPDAIVFRYIKRSELNKIFEERERKIIDFAQNAYRFHQQNDIAYALRYYYWALSLLRSHPNADKIEFTPNSELSHELLVSWLPIQINSIFANLNFSISNNENREQLSYYTLYISHNNKAVNNLDFSFWTGKDWTFLNSAKDGIALIEIEKNDNRENLKIKTEYIYFSESNIDRELRDILEKMDVVPFKSSYFTLPMQASITPKAASSNVLKLSKAPPNVDDFKMKMELISQAIKDKEYKSVENLFTKEAYIKFTKLVAYGNAHVLQNQQFDFSTFNNDVVCRALKLSFTFKNNTKRFVEDIVFHFDKEQLVNNINFSLSSAALSDILGNTQWNEAVRQQIVTFLENYKTAFAVKDISYVENVFADDALIIVGHMLKRQSSIEMKYANSNIVRYNQLSKEQYIKNLRHSFSSNEYINLRFEDNIVKKAGKGGELYGIQIKQDYFSSNYGDSGYLFLLVDMNDANVPTIHVRTWQPQKNADGSIYGLGDF